MAQPVVAVVGAGPGISLAVAARFAREGFHPAMIARRREALDGYVADLGMQGYPATGFPADAGDAESLVVAFASIRAQLGDPAVLVYHAAVVSPGVPSTLDPARVVADFRVNVVGALVAAQQVLPAMRTQQQGTILFTGGGLSLFPAPPYASLAIGKAGIRNLTYSLAGEVADEGIHVATVTVAGFVQPGTFYDPALIAEQFWMLHTQPADAWETEIIYREEH